MDRLKQLERTLLQNIIDNQDYVNLEIVLLDYNSQDNLQEWVAANMMSYIASGKLVYYKTYQPSNFNHSHAKNLAFKLATGDIVCNINADHFAGKGFAQFVNDQFKANEEIVITPIIPRSMGGSKSQKDVFGKVCVKKSDFLLVKGFDERMQTYGFEDFDFINRLEMVNIKRVCLDNQSYLQYISHLDDERFSLQENYANLSEILIQHINPSVSKLIFIYSNGDFEMGNIIDNSTYSSNNVKTSYEQECFEFDYSIEDSKWTKGNWNIKNDDGTIYFETEKNDKFQLKYIDGCYTGTLNKKKAKLFVLKDSKIKSELIDFHYLFINRSLLELNILKREMCPNDKGFGQATIYKNLNFYSPLIIT